MRKHPYFVSQISLLFFTLLMLTFILSTSDEDPPDSDSLSEESESESLSEELASDSELEFTPTLLTVPFFLDLLLDFRFLYLQLRELCPVLLQFEQRCCDFVALLTALATCNFNCLFVRLASSSSESISTFFVCGFGGKSGLGTGTNSGTSPVIHCINLPMFASCIV